MRRWLALLVVAIPAAVVALLWTSPPSQAQPVPQPGLRVVTHDTSLAGSGTTAAPLGLRSDCSSSEVLAWDGDSWECGTAGGGACVAIAGACTQNSDCCTGNCDEGGGTCEAEGGVVAGTNIDVSGSTVSVEPTVDLAGAANENTLQVTQPGGNDTEAVYAGILVTTSGTSAREPPYSTDNPVWGIRILADSYSWDDDFSHINGGLYIDAPSNTPPHVQTGQAIRVERGDVILGDNLQVTGSLGGTGGTSALDIGTDVDVTGDLTATGLISGAQLDSTGLLTVDGNSTLGDASGDTVTINGTTTHTAPTTVQDFRGTQIDVASVTGTQTDWNPTGLATATTIRAATTGSTDLVSLAGGAADRKIQITNAGNSVIRVFHEWTSGTTAAMRFAFNQNFVYIKPAESMIFSYDATSSRWRQASGQHQVDAFYSIGTITADGNQVFGDANTDQTYMRMPKDSGSAPSLSSCGSSPSVVGGNWAFTITTGSGATACTATFTDKGARSICTVTARSGTQPAYTTTDTTLVMSTAAASATYDAICIGDD